MPSDFPNSPKLLKGALVPFADVIPVPTNLIVFQYNPETVARSFQQAGGEGGGDPRLGGGDTESVLQPVETFQLEVELDAADQLEAPRENALTVGVGLHPTLAALELLLYPSSVDLLLNKALALAGSAFISPATAPLVLLVWGPARVVPVKVTSLSITEQAFDPLLNPIRARLTLGLRGMTIAELRQAGQPFETLAIVNQVAKEVLARTNIFNAVEQLGGALPF